ncbi:MAG: hypothetical protein NT019_03295 [Candidatus Adlerbacteria bacterium]|nr:hypothetical protein [Candidatus Adlerbacteria bacterium]
MLLHDAAHKVEKFLSGWRFDPTLVMPGFLLLLVFFAAITDPAVISASFFMIVAFSPLWLPFFLGTALWLAWMHYVRYQFWFSRKRTLLQIQLPAEVTKSPSAMELFLVSIYSTGSETTFVHRFWGGGFRPNWSLEIASNEGRINFYIYGLKIWQTAVEARIYGQYPEAKITEVDDYVTKVPFNLTDYDIWGAEYKKGSIGALPIKTYVDFELDKNTDTPEVTADPLTNMLEIMNDMGPDQYMWVQYIIKARNKEEWYGIYNSADSYKDPANAKIREIMAGAAKRAQLVLKELDVVEGKMNALLTDGEKKIIEAIEHSQTKNLYECGIRALYISKREKFEGINGAFMYRLFEFIKKQNFNSLNGTRGMVAFDFPWEDFRNIRENFIKKLLFFHYRHRAFFYVPYDQVPVFLNVEELATLWHFPNSSVKTPGLDRVPSKSAGAPSNLPVLPQ